MKFVCCTSPELVYVYSIVESVGEGVTEVAPGDHVLPVFTGECKECPHCKSAESNMCDLLRINTDRGVMISDGKSRYIGELLHFYLELSLWIFLFAFLLCGDV